MIRELIPSTDPKLRKKSKPVGKVDKKIKTLIADMKETLDSQTDPEGVGLAAPQIGKNIQIFIMKMTKSDAKLIGETELTKVVMNPEIVSIEKVKKKKIKEKKQILEGCLSLPHFYGPLTRSEKVTIKYLTEEGKIREQTFTGFPAQIVLHEIDHLNGILFVDRLLEQEQPLYEHVKGTWREVELY